MGAVAVSESNPDVVYIGMGETELRGNIMQGDGVYKSIDSGKTWKQVGLADTQAISRIRVHPVNPDVVYVSALGHPYGPNAERGVFRSTDAGDTWVRLDGGPLTVSHGKTAADSAYYAVGDEGASLWRFDKAGWTPFRGQVASTFNVRFPKWIEALWFDINIHLVHHLAPKVPWYHLHAGTEAIRAVNADWVQERAFSLGYLRASWARPLLVRAVNGDHFEMSSFAATEEEHASSEAGAATH